MGTPSKWLDMHARSSGEREGRDVDGGAICTKTVDEGVRQMGLLREWTSLLSWKLKSNQREWDLPKGLRIPAQRNV